MIRQSSSVERRALLGLAIGAAISAMPWAPASAGPAGNASPTVPVEQLNAALLAAMKAGGQSSFDDRYRALAPVIERVFDLDAVLAASIGLSWATMSEAQKAQLEAAFRRYTVSSFVTNFSSYNGQTFQVLPTTRALPDGKVIVQTLMLRTKAAPIKLDYVISPGPAGWRVTDVLTDGAISRVAVQRSDFRGLLMAGGVPALTAGLGRKSANLAGSMAG